MTAKICEILADELAIPGDKVYVTYHGVNDWGWNGSNF
ncbi:MAG: phenylpyruvate tautomerase MIF-related protein [Lachnospiraceae bacterium]|nr:phenylpyruvate tautomerase MIF-related protein [Lachnospiraceae bacterium]